MATTGLGLTAVIPSYYRLLTPITITDTMQQHCPWITGVVTTSIRYFYCRMGRHELV